MRLVFIQLLFISVAFGNDIINQDCYLIKNAIDQKYCIDKKLEAIKVKNKKELSWYNKHGITKENQTKRIQDIDTKILSIQEKKSLLDVELKTLEESKTVILAAKINKKAKPFKFEKEEQGPPKKDVKSDKKEVKEKKAKKTKKKKDESPANSLQGQLNNVLDQIKKK